MKRRRSKTPHITILPSVILILLHVKTGRVFRGQPGHPDVRHDVRRLHHGNLALGRLFLRASGNKASSSRVGRAVFYHSAHVCAVLLCVLLLRITHR